MDSGSKASDAPDMFLGQEEARGRRWATGARLPPRRLTPGQERRAWWPRLRDYMGKDIMSLMSVPVFIMARPPPHPPLPAR